MKVEQNRFGFRKVFVPNDADLAADVARNRARYSRITIMSLTRLELPDFKEGVGKTGLIELNEDVEIVASRFRKTVRNEISRTYRDPGFSIKISPDITDDGYALLDTFFKARGMKSFPRSTYRGCVEFLAYIDRMPVSGVLLYPSAPVPEVAAIFSKRRVTEDFEDYKRVGYAGKRVMLEVCRWGIERGMKAIDLSSLDPDSITVPGISEYKLSFAPTIVPRYTYEYTSPMFRVFENLMILLRSWQRRVSLKRTS